MQGNAMKVGTVRCKLVSGQKSRQLSNWATGVVYSSSVAAYNFFEKRVDFLLSDPEEFKQDF